MGCLDEHFVNNNLNGFMKENNLKPKCRGMYSMIRELDIPKEYNDLIPFYYTNETDEAFDI